MKALTFQGPGQHSREEMPPFATFADAANTHARKVVLDCHTVVNEHVESEKALVARSG